MLIAWLKLRQRNLGPILDANGWAVNARAKINIPFGGSLTAVAALPAERGALARRPVRREEAPAPPLPPLDRARRRRRRPVEARLPREVHGVGEADGRSGRPRARREREGEVTRPGRAGGHARQSAARLANALRSASVVGRARAEPRLDLRELRGRRRTSRSSACCRRASRRAATAAGSTRSGRRRVRAGVMRPGGPRPCSRWTCSSRT